MADELRTVRCAAAGAERGGAGRAFMSFMCSEVHVECMHER